MTAPDRPPEAAASPASTSPSPPSTSAGPPDPATGTATGDLFARLTSDVQELVRREIAQARDDLVSDAKAAAPAVALLAGAGVLGVLAVGSVHSVVLRLLETWLPRPVAALVATGLYGAGAAALAGAGAARLRTLTPPLERTLAGVQADVAAAREAAQ